MACVVNGSYLDSPRSSLLESRTVCDLQDSFSKQRKMAGNGSIIQGALPVFDETLFDDWRIKIRPIFGYQDVSEGILVGIEDPGRKASDEEKKAFKNCQKLDDKAKFLLYKCVSSRIFNKISKAKTAKEAWEILVQMYGDYDKNKKAKLHTIRRKFELLPMEENETIVEYFDKIQELVNAMRACKESITDQSVVDKILRTLPQRFDHLVVTIEETRDLDSMDLEDL